jgi:glycerol transport system ATP-binding protein
MSLSLQGIRKQQAEDIHLYQVNVEFLPGLNVLAGPTTAGKTSLLRIIAGLDKPSAGRVVLMGRDITHIPVQKRGVAIVYQQYINYPNFTVYDNIASPLRIAKLSKREIEKRVREAAGLLAIEDYLQRMPSELSGGQQQRTAIARALVKDANIILFDEPLVNLDYKLREQLRREMRTIFSRQNKIAIYATTEPLEAALLGDNLVVMDRGRVLQTGPGSQLFRQPKTLRVAEILSDPRINSIELKVCQNTARCEDVFDIDLSRLGRIDDDKYLIGLRAHHLQLSNETVNNNREVVGFNAAVTLAEVSGSETLIHVNFAQQNWIVQQAGVHQYEVGESIGLAFKVKDLLLFKPDGERLSVEQALQAAS